MATADIQTFKIDKESLFASALEIISNAGYIISDTEDATKRIVYIAKYDSDARYSVNVSVTSITTAGADLKSAININAAYLTGNGAFGYLPSVNAKRETELINYLISELAKKFTLLPKPANSGESNAPGVGGTSSGCLVLLGFLGLLVAGSGFGCLMLLTTLFH